MYISVANNGQSSAIADRLRTLVGKKKLEITKMTDHFSHTQKKDFKTAKPERFFFSNFIIQLHLNFFQNSDTQETCIRHICV